jgi:hypothetical protein
MPRKDDGHQSVPPGSMDSPEMAAAVQAALFPGGTNFTDEQRENLLEYYKLLSQHTDQLATRRQNLNSFFLSINSMLMAGIGVIGKDLAESHHHRAIIGACIFLIILGLTGLIVGRSWGALIRIYGQMTTANANVTRQLEKHLLAAIFTAQQKLHGTDLGSMARVESRIAHAFVTIYSTLIVVMIFFLFFVHPEEMAEQKATPTHEVIQTP